MTRRRKIAVLEEATRLVRRPHGWGQGLSRQEVFIPYRGKGGGFVRQTQYCAVGALHEARLAVMEQRGSIRSLAKELDLTIHEEYPLVLAGKNAPTMGIVAFNDAKATRRKDVLAVFATTIERLRGGV